MSRCNQYYSTTHNSGTSAAALVANWRGKSNCVGSGKSRNNLDKSLLPARSTIATMFLRCMVWKPRMPKGAICSVWWYCEVRRLARSRYLDRELFHICPQMNQQLTRIPFFKAKNWRGNRFGGMLSLRRAGRSIHVGQSAGMVSFWMEKIIY